MKTKKTIGQFLGITISGASLLLGLGLCVTSSAQNKAAAAPERIGIYDSRAIAIAYTGSSAHQKQLQELMSEHQKAKAAGDSTKAAKLEAEGRALQAKAHQQGFGTAPVDDLLLNITNALPQIKKDAGVTVIISKWDEAALKQHPGAEKVDVTMKLVDAFQPNERQRKFAIDIQKRKPLTNAEVAGIKE